MFCLKCGAKLTDGAQFCQKCGNAEENSQAAPKKKKSKAPIIIIAILSALLLICGACLLYFVMRDDSKPKDTDDSAIQEILDEAAEYADDEDYYEALSIISTALEEYPDSDELKEAFEYYGEIINDRASLDNYNDDETKPVEATTEAPTTEPPETERYIPELDGMIAFITDAGSIDDHSYNQYSYKGVQKFADANDICYGCYKPTEDSDWARIDAMNQAIADGAKVIVVSGWLFGTALDEVAPENPDVLFLALDVYTSDLPSYEIPENLALITYQEEQAGYLAGYAAVAGGYTKLGFLGGIDVPTVVRYGFGFIQGAEAAAAEYGVEGVEINYWYAGFALNDEIAVKMNGWYTAGTEIVFCCGGGIYQSAVNAAEANDGWVIGVDVDQSNESTRILTSAMKCLANSVEYALTKAGDNAWCWPWDFAGQQVRLGAAENCIGLPMENTFLAPFDYAAYNDLLKKLVDGSIVVDDAIDSAPRVSHITVNYQ